MKKFLEKAEQMWPHHFVFVMFGCLGIYWVHIFYHLNYFAIPGGVPEREHGRGRVQANCPSRDLPSKQLSGTRPDR